MNFDGFWSYLEHERRYSSHTLKSYQTDLLQFEAFLVHQYDGVEPDRADHQMIRSWIVEMVELGRSARTVNRKISALKSFFKYMRRTGDVKIDPMQKIIAPKQSKRLPVFVEESGMDQLFDGSIFPDDVFGLRDQLLVSMLYETGIRLSELIALKWRDLDVYTSQIKVLGKRNKERLIPLSNKTISELKSYQVELESAMPEKSLENILVTDKGEKMYPGFVYSKVNFYLSKVTSISKRSPHVLRHTFATHMLNNGADLNVIKEILGHANLGATQVYTHNTIEKLKDVHKLSHPRS